MTENKFGWYLFVELIWIIIGTAVMVALSLSPAATPKVNFYMKWLFVPWGIWIAELGIHFITTYYAGGGRGEGWSIAPLGSYDPDSYILQHFFGYEGAVIIALVSGLALGGFFYYTTSVTQEVWLPVPRMLVRGLSSYPTGTREFFSGRDPMGNMVSDSIPPTLIENSMLIFSFFPMFAIPVRFVMESIGLPTMVAAMMGGVAWVAATSFIFPYVYHAWSYQEVQPAYSKAATFIILNGIPTILTGMPIAFMISHLANNMAASQMMVGIVGTWIVTSYFTHLIINKKIFGGKKK